MKKTILIAWSMLLGLSLLSCNSLFPPDDDARPRNASYPVTQPDSGYNTTATVIPTTPGQPNMWVAWNFNGNATTGSPTNHTVFLGSDDTAFKVGGVTAQQGVSYALLITGLGTSSPSATLTPESGGTSQTVSVTAIEPSTETFAVSIRNTNPTSANLLLCVTHTGGGVRILLEDA